MKLFCVLFGLALFRSSFGAEFLRKDSCNLPYIVGTTPCSKESSVRFFYDSEKDRCYAFRYTGCNGNANSFETRDECEKSCVDFSKPFCPGNTKPTLNVLGSPSPCGLWKNKEGLPECRDNGVITTNGTNYCNRDWGNGICCTVDSKLKLQWDFRSDQCPDGRSKYSPKVKDDSIRGWHYERILLGRDCETDFCPGGYDCVIGNFYSYCCK
uniref:BPTI/Kunitz inhibitor domain-containing protein n=1 Tax=Caenorhabditis tropicalis TaxID=1561998 RepID=A0A1I7TYV9_9PELO